MNFVYCSVGSLTYSVQKSFIATVFQNDDNSSILGVKLCESDWHSDTWLLNYTMFYSYVMNILIFQVRSHTFHDFHT